MRALECALALALCAGAAAAQTSEEPSAEASAAAGAAAPPASGQAPPRPPSATPPTSGRPAPAPTPAPTPRPAPDCSQGCLTAESQGGGEGHYWAQGFVDFRAGELRIQSDRFDLYETLDDQGLPRRRIVAEGNVVFMRGDERLSGQRLDMSLTDDTAVLEEAFGFVQPDVFVEADQIERIDSRTYRIRGGRFTSCYQPNPRWSFRATTATLKRDDRITARNVVFRVKAVPTLYLPFFYYPIKESRRATGFLFPRFGYSNFRGFNIGTGFFWAMARNYDQTFSVDHYSKFGIDYGHEFRYVGLGPSNGTFRTSLFDRSDIDARDYDINWNAVQKLPGTFRASLSARLFSSTSFQQLAQDTLNLASSRSQRAALNLQGRLAGQSVQLVSDYTETFFGEDSSRTIQRLPALRVSKSRSRIGRTGIVFGYEARAERLAKGDQDELVPYQRFDIAPSVSRPWATSFLQVDPSVDLRYTRYGDSFDEEGGFEGGALDRRVFEANVEMRGPSFAKVFSLGNFYSPRFKHEIGPELIWTYRSAVEEFDAIPKFDGIDQLLGTNQLRYSLVQKLLAKRPNRAGKLVTHEVLFWRLSQTYFAQISDNQAEFDPNYSSAFFGPGGEPSHYSPLQSRLRFTPAREVATTFDVEYDVNFKQLRTLGLGLNMRLARGDLRAGWSKAQRLAESAEDRVTTRNTLRAAGRLDVLPGNVDLEGAVDYDFVQKQLIRWSARSRLGVQCCALMLELISFNYNQRNETQFRFALELANIGSFGFGTGEQQLGR